MAVHGQQYPTGVSISGALSSNHGHMPTPRRGRGGVGGHMRRVSPPGGEPSKRKSKFLDGTSERSIGELEFFDRVKRFFNHNEQVYAEFLKCLNWYTQDIIKKSDLVTLAQSFIGRNDELFTWFKQFIGFTIPGPLSNEGGNPITDPQSYYPRSHLTQHHHHMGASGMASESMNSKSYTGGPGDSYLLDLSSCKRIGSYRFLPKNYQQPTCSGRTELCTEVLNDNMVSCPSFTSEDSTFVSSKKNIYEEALFRCEDERYELDRLIDGNQATLLILESIWKKLTSMTNTSEAESYTLTDTLGGSSEVIHKAIIAKIYGPKADEVLDALKRTPWIALPIIMRRIRQKDEEWRTAQREWNKIWRDIHYKNYYKALDNQSVNFKNSDKKVLSVKSLINELQTIYYEQSNVTSNVINGVHTQPPLHLLPSSQGLTLLEKMAPAPPLPFVSSPSNPSSVASVAKDGDLVYVPYQMEFKIGDKKILVDLVKLLLCHIVKAGPFHASERRSLWKFVLNFIPDFFSMSIRLENKDSATGEDHETIYEKLESGQIQDCSTIEVILQPCVELKRNEFINFNNHYNILYGNELLYALFRLIQIAYHRLEQMKNISSNAEDCEKEGKSSSLHHYHKKNYVATFLDIQKKHLSGSSFTSDYYSLLLDMIISMAEDSVEQATFEEKIRFMFGAYSYIMFTFDRLLISILRTIVSILSDSTCEHMIALYDSYKKPTKGTTGIFSEYAYKIAASSLLMTTGAASPSIATGNDEGEATQDTQNHLFRIDSQKETHADVWWLKFKYIPQMVMMSTEQQEESQGKSDWGNYIERFVGLNYNASILKMKPPLLLCRNLKRTTSSPNRQQNMIIQFHLECKINVKTLKMYFVDHSEDFLFHYSDRAMRKAVDKNGDERVRRSSRFSTWLDQRFKKEHHF